MAIPLPPTTIELFDYFIDRGYYNAVSSVTNAIKYDLDDGIIRRSLDDLARHADDLARSGGSLTQNDPVLNTLRNNLRSAMVDYADRIDDAAQNLQLAGIDAAGDYVYQAMLPGFGPQGIPSLGIRFNIPDPEAILRAIDVTGSDAWKKQLATYVKGVDDVFQNIAVRGIVNGWGPQRTAALLARTIEGLPNARATNLMRTLQLNSYRKADVIHSVANSDILTKKKRLAALDTRTCPACLGLHGTDLALDEEVIDHYQGRCTSINIVAGFDRNIPSGEDWLKQQSDEDQRRIMGDSAYLAWKDGKVNLKDFAGTYKDPVFGTMLREKPLAELLGKDEWAYYRNQARDLPPLPKGVEDDQFYGEDADARARAHIAEMKTRALSLGFDERWRPVTDEAFRLAEQWNREAEEMARQQTGYTVVSRRIEEPKDVPIPKKPKP